MMDVCRTCMKPHRQKRNRKPMVPIFAKLNGLFIANIVANCATVEINVNDALPKTICSECFETVKLLSAFAISVRDSDVKLRKMCKGEPGQEDCPTDSDQLVTLFLEVKSEPLEQNMVDETTEEAAPQSDDFESENDTDSEWEGSDEEKERTMKRKRLCLNSKSKPLPKKRERFAREPKSTIGSTQDKKDVELSGKERELFTVINIPLGSHVCCGCLMIFSSAEELEAHRKLSHVLKNQDPSQSETECNGCLRRFCSSSNVGHHKKRVRLLKVIWECNKCKLRFKVAAKRRKHVRLHPDDEFGWMCCAVRCTQSFKTEQELLIHAHATHWIEKQKADLEAADKPEQCLVCYQRFSDRNKLMIHQRRKQKRENFQCALCGLKFPLITRLQSHEVKEHGSKAFQCKICDKYFTDQYTLNNHLKIIHTEEKPFQCTVCGMTFRRKGNLSVHMSNHVVDPQFKCEICFKMFKAKLHLRYHMRTHTGEKPHKCRVCGHAFANHTNCRRHEMTHTGDKPHKCSYCEKSFSLKRMLLEHESTHTGEPVVKCKICNQRFRQQSDLDSHMETVHVAYEGDVDSYSVDNSDVNVGHQAPTPGASNVRPATVAVQNANSAKAGHQSYKFENVRLL